MGWVFLEQDTSGKANEPNFGGRKSVAIKNSTIMQELDPVILTINRPESQLQKGDVGTIVMTYDNGKAFDV